MAKIKLKALESYRFTYPTVLKARDINYGGHLGNDALVALLQEARIALFRELGATELDLGDGETGIIMSDLVVSYRAEGKLFDAIEIHSEFIEVKAASFRMAHRVSRGEETLALAEVGLVTFDYRDRRIAPIPEGFLEKIGS